MHAGKKTGNGKNYWTKVTFMLKVVVDLEWKNVFAINVKRNSMKVVINGIVYVPKELEKEVEPIIVEKNYKFELHPIISNNELKWDDAVAYVKSLGNDWRLPTIEECFIMYNNKVITEEVYWSSTEYYDYNAWNFSFNIGDVSLNDKNFPYYVRAVRSI